LQGHAWIAGQARNDNLLACPDLVEAARNANLLAVIPDSIRVHDLLSGLWVQFHNDKLLAVIPDSIRDP
jgi:nicotinic acid phosphoribosyltransferase